MINFIRGCVLLLLFPRYAKATWRTWKRVYNQKFQEIRERQRQEAERLDRIRNPERYKCE